MKWKPLAIVLPLLIAGCSKQPSGVVAPPGAAKTQTKQRVTIAMMPKLKGIDYFNACEKGAQEAAKELNVNLVFDGPTEGKVDLQNQMLDSWIVQKVDAIACATNDPDAIAPYLRKARQAGIPVLTYDADARKDAREFFVNQATFEAIGNALVDEMAAQASDLLVRGEDAKVAIVTSSLTAPNQNAWIKWMKKRIKEKHPKMQLVDIKPAQEDQQQAFRITQDLLKANPDLKGVFGLSSVAFPGAADAVRQMQLSGKVAVVGLSTPKQMKEFVDDGTVKTVILWNPVDLGYLTVYAAKAIIDGKLKPGAKSIDAGRLGKKEIVGDEIMLGAPMRFTKANIAKYNF